jgi:hypothetical protein
MSRQGKVNQDGTLTCVCGQVITFLPPDLPGGGPNSVNHTGCSAALDGTETINLVDRAEVEAFYASKGASS